MIRLSAVILAAALAGCSDVDYSNEVSAEILSPNGAKKVVIFSRDCGATTGFNTQASILDRAQVLPDDGGSAFIIDGGSARVSWADDANILVTFESNTRVFKKELSDHDVTIDYKTK